MFKNGKKILRGLLRRLLSLLIMLLVVGSGYVWLVFNRSAIPPKRMQYSLYDGNANHIADLRISTKGKFRMRQWVPRPNMHIELEVESLEIEFFTDDDAVKAFPTSDDKSSIHVSGFPFYIPETFSLVNEKTETSLVIRRTQKQRIEWKLYTMSDGQPSKHLLDGPGQQKEL